jgi:hypothetical protein
VFLQPVLDRLTARDMASNPPSAPAASSGGVPAAAAPSTLPLQEQLRLSEAQNQQLRSNLAFLRTKAADTNTIVALHAQTQGGVSCYCDAPYVGSLSLSPFPLFDISKFC